MTAWTGLAEGLRMISGIVWMSCGSRLSDEVRAVVLDVAAQADTLAVLLHVAGMQRRERRRVRHRQSVTVVAERLLVAHTARRAIRERRLRMLPDEVGGVRERDPVAADAEVVGVTRGAGLQIAHAVGLLPGRAVRDLPLAG